MKKGILIVALIGLLLAAGMVFSSCGLRDCDAGSCGRIVANCGQTYDGSNGCRALIGGYMSCSEACGR